MKRIRCKSDGNIENVRVRTVGLGAGLARASIDLPMICFKSLEPNNFVSELGQGRFPGNTHKSSEDEVVKNPPPSPVKLVANKAQR